MTTTNNSTSRKCSYCDKSDTEVVLFRIIIPDIVDGYFCRQCIQIAVDNSNHKNKPNKEKLNDYSPNPR